MLPTHQNQKDATGQTTTEYRGTNSRSNERSQQSARLADRAEVRDMEVTQNEEHKENAIVSATCPAATNTTFREMGPHRWGVGKVELLHCCPVA